MSTETSGLFLIGGLGYLFYVIIQIASRSCFGRHDLLPETATMDTIFGPQTVVTGSKKCRRCGVFV